MTKQKHQPREMGMIFSAPMVRAVLAGAKDVTRRLGTRYRTGDLIWMKETFQPILAEGIEGPREADWDTGAGYQINYVATGGIREYYDEDEGLIHRCTPAIYMKKWMARRWFLATVTPERLHDITCADAVREGIAFMTAEQRALAQRIADDENGGILTPVLSYRVLWNAINAARVPWAGNPIVQRIKLQIIEHRPQFPGYEEVG